jgi:hypothetical protein
MIFLRKDLEVREPRQGRLFADYTYFIYITNDPALTPEEVVFSANDRCQQENVIAQLKSLRALHSPVDNLVSNQAYMLMTSLAWTLKAWLALWPLEAPGRWRERHQEQKRKLLQMEWRTFVNYWMRIPCQVVRTERKIVLRLLAHNPWQSVFFRFSQQLCRPLRC